MNGEGSAPRRARLETWCRNGHKKAKDNVRIRRDARTGRPYEVCVECQRAAKRRWKRAKEGVITGPRTKQKASEAQIRAFWRRMRRERTEYATAMLAALAQYQRWLKQQKRLAPFGKRPGKPAGRQAA